MLDLVTDRTLDDYRRWLELRNKGWANMSAAERTEWAAPMKGAYGISDLNRVGAALNYLLRALADATYLSGDEFTAKENWTATEVPTANDLSNLLLMVATIRGALTVWASTPRTPADTGTLDYTGANNIEKILADVDQLVTNMIAAQYYSGELYSGEV